MIYRIILNGSLIVGACLLSGCGADTSSIQKVHSPVIINVLDAATYKDCHIKGSVHVPFNKVSEYVVSMPKDTHIVIYCSNYACTTSAFVARRLMKDGYTNVQVYEGGMAEWYNAQLPVEGSAQATYLQHTMVPPSDLHTSDVAVITKDELVQLLKF